MTAFFIFWALSLVLIGGYIAYAISKVGIPTSICSSCYRLKEQKFRFYWLYYIAFCLGAVISVPPFVEASPEQPVIFQFMAFISCGAVLFNGGIVFGTKEDNTKAKIALVSIAALLAFMWMNMAYWWSWIPLSISLGVAVWRIIKTPDKWIFWIEAALLASLYVNVLIALLIKSIA